MRLRCDMSVRDKIKERMDEIQNKMETGNREGIQEKITSVAKFWSALSEEDRDYLNAVRYAVEENKPWK
jgi:hypothetical protein